jgi:hypothetical protein
MQDDDVSWNCQHVDGVRLAERAAGTETLGSVKSWNRFRRRVGQDASGGSECVVIRPFSSPDRCHAISISSDLQIEGATVVICHAKLMNKVFPIPAAPRLGPVNQPECFGM